VAGDPNVIRTGSGGHHLRRARLLNDHNAGRSGIIVQGKSKVKAEADAAITERNCGNTGKKAGAE
jgi:hypothetical protein